MIWIVFVADILFVITCFCGWLYCGYKLTAPITCDCNQDGCVICEARTVTKQLYTAAWYSTNR